MSASEGAASDHDQLINFDCQQISEPPQTSNSSGAAAGDDVENADPEMFATPTSTPHRIPTPTICPPAPRRPWPKPSRNYVAGVMVRPFHLTMEEILSAWQTRSRRRLPYRRVRFRNTGRCMRF